MIKPNLLRMKFFCCSVLISPPFVHRRHMGGGTLSVVGKKDAVRLFTCPVCEKSFVSKGNLSNHIKVHSSEGYHQVQDRYRNFS